jgi:hypothetical protein
MILGTACLIIGAITLFQLATGAAVGDMAVAHKQSEFLPVSGLIISTSQALLFTAALLSLYNSRLLNGDVILWNILPIALFALIYAMCREEPEVAIIVKKVFFGFYITQLIGYTVAFFNERDRYLCHLEDWFDDWGLREYRRNGIVALFVCSLVVGVAALASYFFTELWHLTVFIAACTAYYAAVAIYFLKYRRHSEEIFHVTTPEDWDNPKRETYRKIMDKQS